MTGRVHIVGSGLAGLSAAVTAARAGKPVTLYEATKSAGGRCRSFYDSHLDATVDNGSHVVLGANPAVFSYLDSISARDQLISINPTGKIPFVDLTEDETWELDPGASRVPWWIFDKKRRAPSTKLAGYLRGLGLLLANPNQSVSDVIPAGDTTTRRFWDPFTVAVMNTSMEQASASLLGGALKQAFASKGGGFQAYVPKTSLAETFVTTALKYLEACGADVRLETPVKSVSTETALTALQLRAGTVPLAKTDTVVLALPPWSPTLEPFLEMPIKLSASPIVNVHFKYSSSTAPAPMTGVIGGTAHWVFTRDGLISATVSAASTLSEMTHEAIAKAIWLDIQHALDIESEKSPPYRVIIERRATPLQDCAFAAGRPSAQTGFSNLFLAGDWLNTGLPCTLESAIKSGQTAAEHALKGL